MPSVVIGRLRAIDGEMMASRTPDGALVAESITRNEDDPLPPQA